MALNQSLAQLRTSVRSFANVGGATALLRHPDAEISDYVLRAIGSLYRHLTEAVADQLFLASTTITTVSGQTTYSLPSDFDSLISADLTAYGVKVWLTSYENNERPALTDPSLANNGVPTCYRLRGGTIIELLPAPGAGYTVTLWYVPDAQQPAEGQVFDTISRLDDYIVAYAARLVATKDKNWDLVNECRTVCKELEAEIAFISRSRDRNSPSRITDQYVVDRWGRHLPHRRRFR